MNYFHFQLNMVHFRRRHRRPRFGLRMDPTETNSNRAHAFA